MRSFLATLTAVTLLVLLIFTGLRLLDLTSSTLVDWIIGIGIFWWLAAVVVLPWNTYFAAKDVLAEARQSQDKGIAVDPETVAFAQRLARRFLLLAVVLHVLSAVGLYLMAYYQLTSLGYVASVAALLLTFARPLSGRTSTSPVVCAPSRTSSTIRVKMWWSYVRECWCSKPT